MRQSLRQDVLVNSGTLETQQNQTKIQVLTVWLQHEENAFQNGHHLYAQVFESFANQHLDAHDLLAIGFELYHCSYETPAKCSKTNLCLDDLTIAFDLCDMFVLNWQ